MHHYILHFNSQSFFQLFIKTRSMNCYRIFTTQNLNKVYIEFISNKPNETEIKLRTLSMTPRKIIT